MGICGVLESTLGEKDVSEMEVRMKNSFLLCFQNRHYSLTTTDTGLRIAPIALPRQDLSRSLVDGSASFLALVLQGLNCCKLVSIFVSIAASALIDDEGEPVGLNGGCH